MIKDTYPYYPSKNKLMFIFRSEGSKGTINKLIIFTREKRKNDWNLAFGDLKEDDIDDLVISNNQDAMKIIRTVAKATLEFLEIYPKSKIFINPVDEKRKKLYNHIFRRHFKEMHAIFKIVGRIGKSKEVYKPTSFYDSFTITLKSKLK